MGFIKKAATIILLITVLFVNAVPALGAGVQEDSVETLYWVTFVGHVDPEIPHFVYLQVINNNTEKIYDFKIFKHNQYTLKEQLPAGNYTIIDGGLLNDYRDKYPIITTSFDVGLSQNVVVDFTVGNPDRETQPPQETGGEVVVITEEDVTENHSVEEATNAVTISEPDIFKNAVTKSPETTQGIVTIDEQATRGYILAIAVFAALLGIVAYVIIAKKRK